MSVFFKRRGAVPSVPSVIYLDYIQSSGTQYIDTGFIPNHNTRVDADIYVDSTPSRNAWLFGSRNSAASARFEVIWINGASAYRFYYGSSNYTFSGIAGTGRLNVSVGSGSATINGVSVNPTATTFAGTNSLYLFSCNGATAAEETSYQKLYSCQIYDNDVLVRDFRPAMLPDTFEVGLYDLVTRKFYGNTGTGYFIPGPVISLPDGYTKLACIEATGKQYIDTEYIPTNDMELSIDFVRTNANNWICGNVYGAGAANDTGISASAIRFANKYASYSFSTGTRYSVTYNKSGYTVNGATTSWAVTTASFTTSLYLFTARGSSGSPYGKIYSCVIRDKGVLVRLFTPCMAPDGSIGLYDSITEAFFGNAGTGVFTGPGFADYSWAEIIHACRSGAVPSDWAVGDQKTMTINGTDYAIDIIGKAHDDYTDGSGKAPLTFQMHDCYGTTYKMNSTASCSSGWTSCAMRTTHLPAILALMPAEVQAGIKEVNKVTTTNGRKFTMTTTADKLFLLAETEIFASPSISYVDEAEGVRYAYYANGGSRVKKRSGSAAVWWERSPVMDSDYEFCCITTSGATSLEEANVAQGVAFAFCF